MVHNVGTVDRVVRIVAGLGIGAAGIALGSWWGAVGAIPLLTAALGWCPAYCPFNITTRRAERSGGAGADGPG